jgi:hypothetical protein
MVTQNPLELAKRCRSEARLTADPDIASNFRQMADDLEALAKALDSIRPMNDRDRCRGGGGNAVS